MPTATTPIRLDRDLDTAARETARLMSRSVAEQVSHWARLGRELERSPDVSVAQIQAVLAGKRSYDHLNPPEQALVRAAWSERLAESRATLDLAQEFEAEGHRYAELDEHDNVRVVTPGGEPTANLTR